MRVLLLQPPAGARFGFSQAMLIEPLGLEMVGASLKAHGHSVRLIDLRRDRASRLDALLESFLPQAAGISCGFTTDVYTTLIAARRIKERRPGTVVFCGGHHASLIPGDLLFPNSPVDAVVIGEGEQAAVELTRALARKGDPGGVPGVMTNGNRRDGFEPRPWIEDLDELPLPTRNLTRRYRRRYHHGFSVLSAAMETSRGCPFDCENCSVWPSCERRTRRRSPERIVEDLEQVAALGGRNVFITDEATFRHRDTYEELGERILDADLDLAYACETRADLVIRHGDLLELWKRAGLETIFLGIESFDDDRLDRLRKRTRDGGDANLAAIEMIRKAGITPMTSLTTDPDWTNDEFDCLEQSLDDLRLPTPAFTILTPLPGTELWETRKRQVTTGDYGFYDGIHLVLPARLGPEQFYERLARLHTRTEIRMQLTGPALVNLLDMTMRSRGSIVRRVFGAVSAMRDPSAYLGYPGAVRKPGFVPQEFGTVPWVEQNRSYLACSGLEPPSATANCRFAASGVSVAVDGGSARNQEVKHGTA